MEKDKKLKYPSSTQVMGLYSDFSSIPEHVLEYAAERGSKVHQICSCIALGVPFYGEIPADHAGFVESFQKWFEFVDEVVHVESRFFDYDLGYCGKPDLVVKMRGDYCLSVPDLKTPATCQRVWRGQMASYKNLAQKCIWHRYATKRAFSVRLKKNGGMPIIDEYDDDARDMAAFINALSAYKYFKN